MPDHSGSNKLSKSEMALVRAYIQARRDEGAPDTVIGAKLGVSQSLISRIMSEDAPHTITIGTARKMAATAGASYDVFTRGTENAGRWETVDPIKMRGRALDLLSTVYDEEFLDAVQRMPPPPESDSWTTEQWHDFVTDVRKAWKSGVFPIAGLPPPKRK